MFYIKKILESCLYPVTIIVILLLIGLILLYCRKIRIGRLFVFIGLVVLLIASTPWLPNLLLIKLQNQYPPLLQASKNAQFIVVLGGGVIPISNVPATDLLETTSLKRTIEAVRLWQQIPTAKIIVSGGDYFKQFNDSDYMAKFAELMGVPQRQIILDNISLDTTQEAITIKKIVKNAPFILVTSAFHMPRAMMLFQQQGMQPVPAPCNFVYVDEKHLREFFPSLFSISKLDIAIHEYQGLGWNKLKRK